MRVSSFLALFALTLAWGQAAVVGPSAVYEGQKVSAVELIANPHRDVAPLRAVVAQKPNTPYSQKEIESSIDALQHAGGFQKVTVNVVPDLAGLRVEFLLEPAYFIGIVSFPGASGEFSYTRLLQVANLPDEDPYIKTRMDNGTQALQEFFKRNGFFESRTEASAQIDDAHQLVSVSYTVILGQRARIAEVQIEGTNAEETARLLRSTQSLRARLSGGLLKRGKPYTEQRLKNATNLIKRSLSKQQRLASDVAQNPPQFHAEGNLVDVSFKVKLGPMVSVRVSGAKLTRIPFLSGYEMHRLIPIYSERSIDSELVQEGKENLTDYFQKKGYSDVSVNVKTTEKADRIEIAYEINRGQKYKVDRISFRGDANLPAAKLASHVTVKKAHFWSHGLISQKLVRESVSNLEAIYRDRGYEDVKVTSRVTKRAPKIDVEFDIEEGAQTLVAEINVTGNEHIPRDQLTMPKAFELKAGAPYSPRALLDDRNRITATYLDHGYPNVEVKTKITRHTDDAHRIDVSYLIDEHQLVRVGNIVYLGQVRTRLSLIKKTAKLDPEAPVKRVQMLGAETRLYDLNILDWASVGPRRPITDQTEETALVKVHEAKRNDIVYGFGFEVSHRGGNVPSGTIAVPGLPTINLGNYQIAPSQATYASPRGLIEFNRRNMRGLGETASASLLLSRLDQRFLTTYSQPHFFESQWSSLSSFSMERTTENPLFAATLGDASFQVERTISQKKNTRLQLRYDFNKTILSEVLVPELVLSQDRNVLLSTFSGTLIRDTRDHPLDAHRGVFETVNLGITPTALGSSANFLRFFGQYATYKSFHSVVFAESIRLGLAKAFSSSFIPTSQLFFSGGGTSLRGFPIDEAGPQRLVPFCTGLQNQTGCVNVTVPVGGNELFIFNSEVRFPLHIPFGFLKPLGGVVFYDGGNVYSAINLPNFVNNFTNTIGVGLRYATPIGPIRFDLGYNLNATPGIGATQYFITLGQAF